MGKLRDQMKSAMMVRGYSPHTQRLYLTNVRLLAKYYHRSPDAITEPEIEKFLIHLAEERKLSKGTINTYVHSLRFFYKLISKGKPGMDISIPRSREKLKIPDLLSPKEAQNILDHTTSLKYRTMFMLAYGAGLRATEITHLTIDDIDSQRMFIHIRVGKGKRERYALLSPQLLEALRIY